MGSWAYTNYPFHQLINISSAVNFSLLDNIFIIEGSSFKVLFVDNSAIMGLDCAAREAVILQQHCLSEVVLVAFLSLLSHVRNGWYPAQNCQPFFLSGGQWLKSTGFAIVSASVYPMTEMADTLNCLLFSSLKPDSLTVA
ncbi:hypothetical protein DFH08DRAFT_822383 [Mycena albidolilacea]|uniref:Uncharacterized protein n=1 Tax=Mycena albidolilacea TaxID=1033008 RepID=A0AAD6Z8M0_9AGAR|nr:hypothetical protein DFH08DRAFT_822383 [Mycena albidolilacea]